MIASLLESPLPHLLHPPPPLFFSFHLIVLPLFFSRLPFPPRETDFSSRPFSPREALFPFPLSLPTLMVCLSLLFSSPSLFCPSFLMLLGTFRSQDLVFDKRASHRRSVYCRMHMSRTIFLGQGGFNKKNKIKRDVRANGERREYIYFEP